jgi:hypothetical protein
MEEGVSKKEIEKISSLPLEEQKKEIDKIIGDKLNEPKEQDGQRMIKKSSSENKKFEWGIQKTTPKSIHLKFKKEFPQELLSKIEELIEEYSKV